MVNNVRMIVCSVSAAAETINPDSTIAVTKTTDTVNTMLEIISSALVTIRGMIIHREMSSILGKTINPVMRTHPVEITQRTISNTVINNHLVRLISLVVMIIPVKNTSRVINISRVTNTRSAQAKMRATIMVRLLVNTTSRVTTTIIHREQCRGVTIIMSL